MFMAQRIALVTQGGATSEQHQCDPTADDLLDRLPAVIAHIIPDQIKTLSANAAHEFRANFKKRQWEDCAKCLRPIREAWNDQSINQRAQRKHSAPAYRQDRSNVPRT